MIASGMSSHSLCVVSLVAVIYYIYLFSAGCFNYWRIFWCWGKDVIYSDFAEIAHSRSKEYGKTNFNIRGHSDITSCKGVGGSFDFCDKV